MASSSRWRRLLSSSPFRYQLTRRHLSSSLGPPPPVTPRRVVVTGIGMVTPLGCGVPTTWKRLIEGECGVRAITPEDLKMNSSFDRETQLYTFDQLTSKVAAVVPCGTKTGEFNADLWLNSKVPVKFPSFLFPSILHSLFCFDLILWFSGASISFKVYRLRAVCCWWSS